MAQTNPFDLMGRRYMNNRMRAIVKIPISPLLTPAEPEINKYQSRSVTFQSAASPLGRRSGGGGGVNWFIGGIKTISGKPMCSTRIIWTPISEWVVAVIYIYGPDVIGYIVSPTRLSHPLQCYHMGHSVHGINLYGVLIIYMHGDIQNDAFCPSTQASEKYYRSKNCAATFEKGIQNTFSNLITAILLISLNPY